MQGAKRGPSLKTTCRYQGFQIVMKSLVLSLLLCFSSIAYGSTAIYSCDIKILNKNFVGWIPYSFQVTFYDNGARAKVGYGHDFETIALGRYSSTFKDLTGKITLTTKANKKYETKHAITIFKDNKIIYDFSTVGADHAYIAYGKCTMPSASTATKSSSSTTNAKKSGSCSLRPAACTDIQLCGKAIAISNGSKIWETRKTYLPHVREAKRRGLICGTTPNAGCGSGMSKCAKLSGFQITVLVKGRTLKGRFLDSGDTFKEMYGSDGSYSLFINGAHKPKFGHRWRVSYDDQICYVHSEGGDGCTNIYKKWDKSNAKWSYLFYSETTNEVFAEITASGDIESSPTPVETQPTREESKTNYTSTKSLNCSLNPAACTDIQLCGKAIAISNGSKIWETRKTYLPHVREAKRRGLVCGTKSGAGGKAVPRDAPQEKKTIKKTVKPSGSLTDPLHLKNYGKAFYTPLTPNVLFFIGEIEDGDERGLRRALRSNDINTIVLVSPGGLIYTGLELANIIYDNNLTSYIPAGQTCASSCSFMFFAGSSKIAHGRLGVHQFYVDDDQKKVAIGKAQRGTQYTVADIIQTLTDFGTPASVFPKMFSTRGMYYFSEEEKDSFSNSNAIESDTVTKINQVLVYFTKLIGDELDDAVLNSMPSDVRNTLIELELIRIGCMKGPADGVRGENTTSAIQLLLGKTGIKLSTEAFSDLFRRINNTEAGACY